MEIMMGTTGKRWGILLVPGLMLSVLLSCSRRQAPERSAAPVAQPASAPAPAPAPASDHRAVIAAFGDSLSAGHGAPVGDSYPDYLQKQLTAKGYAYRVVNLGISGNTTTDGLERIDSVLALQPAIVILELGGNDGLRGIPIADSRANLDRMIIELQQAHIKILLAGMSLPPNYGPDYIHSFQAMYTGLARRHKLPLIPFLLQDIVKQAKANPGLIQPDGIHPTAAGNRIVAGTVMQYLQPMLRPGEQNGAGSLRPARPGAAGRTARAGGPARGHP